MAEEKTGNDEDEGDDDVEAECKAEFKPVVKLEIVEGAEATTTGEEDEDILFEACVRGEAIETGGASAGWDARRERRRTDDDARATQKGEIVPVHRRRMEGTRTRSDQTSRAQDVEKDSRAHAPG